MNRLEEMFGAQLELDIFGHPVVDHQRAEQGSLRLNIVRELNRRFAVVNQSDRVGHLTSMAQGYRNAKRQPRG